MRSPAQAISDPDCIIYLMLSGHSKTPGRAAFSRTARRRVMSSRRRRLSKPGTLAMFDSASPKNHEAGTLPMSSQGL